MTKIHHATLKAAADAGFELFANDDGTIRVVSKEPKFQFEIEASAKEALEDAKAFRMIRTEYNLVKIAPPTEDGWTLTAGEIGAAADRLQDAFDLLVEQAQENGVEIESEEVVHVVVPQEYKIRYAEGGHPNHCGDWFATVTDGKFDVIETDADGKSHKGFNEPKFTQFLIDNGVEMKGKWAALPESGQRGWVGRYRMNGGQKARIRVATTGKLVLEGETLTPPKADLEALWRKHPEAYTAFDEAQQPKKNTRK